MSAGRPDPRRVDGRVLLFFGVLAVVTIVCCTVLAALPEPNAPTITVLIGFLSSVLATLASMRKGEVAARAANNDRDELSRKVDELLDEVRALRRRAGNDEG